MWLSPADKSVAASDAILTRPLAEALPGPLAGALDHVWSLLPEARLVGGAVRDLIAEREVHDLDLATPRPPEEVLRVIGNAGLTALPTGMAHGTVSAMVGPERIEITTLRRDVETDGRHATVAWTDDWREDAARRDFTFNAMSLDRDGGLHDYFGGVQDLREGRVRFVGDPALRIAEDRLRVLRYFRFLARFGGDVASDDDAVGAIAAATGGLGSLSPERIWSELRRLFETPQIGASVGLMDRLGVLGALFGGDLRDDGVAALQRMEVWAPDAPPPIVRLAWLVRREGVDRVGARLRLSRAEAALLKSVLMVPSLSPAADDDELRVARDQESAEILVGRTWLAEAWDDSAFGSDPGSDHRWAGLRSRLAAMEPPRFPIQGADVIAAGVASGPAVGAMLVRLRRWWRGQGCRPDRAACLAELARLL